MSEIPGHNPRPEFVLPEAALRERRQAVREHYDKIAPKRLRLSRRARYFYKELTRYLGLLIETGKRVLMVRSDTGDILAGVRPADGVGIEISPALVDVASALHPNLEFVVQDPETMQLKGRFDYVLYNGVGETVDVVAAFERLRQFVDGHARILVMSYSYLWQPLFKFGEWLGLKVPQRSQNWLSTEDLENILQLTGYEIVKSCPCFLLPIYIPILSRFLNRIAVRLPGLRRLAVLQILVARPIRRHPDRPDYSVSIIVPCRDEVDNIGEAVRRIPDMGAATEIIFCDDRSEDGTAGEVMRQQKQFPNRDIRLVYGPGINKARNVWTGFDQASNDILMILDADLTVPPEELPYFYRAIAYGSGEFINGSRMVYPMVGQAMRTLNILGNKFFSLAFSFLLEQRIKDTLCGTKVMWRKDYERIKRLRGSWGVDDRWGDYELLFGASKLNLQIVDLPVHYFERVHGETKMKRRFENGWIMLRMCVAALFRLKFS